MALGDVVGSMGFGPIDFSAIVDKLYFYIGLFFILFVIGGTFMILYYIRSKNKTAKLTKKIGWWEEVGGQLIPSNMEDAEEIVIPGTTLRVFYVKKRDLWLPRFSRGVTKDLFYVLLTPTRQMINFSLRSISKDLKEAKLDYDHTDMLWAAENTREFIKRNYKDKSIKWWQAYQGVITTAAYIMVMTFSFIIIIYFLRGVVEDIGGVARTLSETLKTSCAAAQTSGVTPA